MGPRRLVAGVICSAACSLMGCERPGVGTSRAAPSTATAAESRDVGDATNVIVVPPNSPQVKQLRVEPVRLQNVVIDEVVAPGRVGVDPNRVSRVLPPVQGRVLEVRAKLGDFVEQGQPLLSLDSPDADAAVSTYRQTEAAERQATYALTKTEADVRRTQDLYEHRAVAEKDVLGARNDLAQAKATVEMARAASEQARRKLELLGLTPAAVRQPTVVRAPISGKVIEINVTPGEYRGAVASHSDTTTTPLMTIADLSTVWISADVPEPSIRLIHLGEEVTITLVAFPDERLRGRVARIADVLDPQTRTLKVHVELPNPLGRFRPEMFGSIRHVGGARVVPVVPPAAVVEEYGGAEVFLERAPGQFERRPITVGPRSGDVVAVLRGLAINDRVVVGGAMLLKGQ